MLSRAGGGTAGFATSPARATSTASRQAGRSSFSSTPAIGSGGYVVGERFDLAGGTAPTALDRLDHLVDHGLVLHRQLTADGEVVVRPGATGTGDVEPGEVAARGASVSVGGGHVRMLPTPTGDSRTPSTAN